MDVDLLRQHVANGLVSKQDHGEFPLSIYNYSRVVQYDRLWDDVTLQTRGLVMHGDQIVARPFRKFFNESEHEAHEIPWHLPCEITEKMDGSLLILFCFNGHWMTATRGSFFSEQAAEGQKIIREQCANHCFDPSLTYLFEVLYPQNRIVVNYGDRREVVLLGMIETATGNEISLDNAGLLKTVRRLPPNASVTDLRSIIRDDEEGYVVRFENDFRIKVKGERYMELHRIITGLSSRTIWENLSKNQPLDDLLAIAPDEFGEWVRQERSDQLAAFSDLDCQVNYAFNAVRNLPDRKSQALELMANHRDVASAVFARLDGKETASILWKKLYPEYRRPSIADRMEA